MAVQFAQCVKERIERQLHLTRVELYLDVWTSLNGRFTQRMYDPERDILAVKWSPFVAPNWVLPILGESEKWRMRLEQINSEIEQSLNGSYLVYVADFPGKKSILH